MCINCLLQQTAIICVEHQTVSFFIDSNFFYQVEIQILNCIEVNLSVRGVKLSIACLLQI